MSATIDTQEIMIFQVSALIPNFADVQLAMRGWPGLGGMWLDLTGIDES